MANLTSDKNLDKHLKPIKSGEDLTSLELASEGNGAKVKGDFTVSGKYETITLKDDALLRSDGDINIEADGADINFRAAGIAYFNWNALGTLTMYSLSDQDDSFINTIGANGSTTLGTVDDTGTAAHLTLQPDGDLIFNPESGKYLAKHNNAEFSAANSAYAGMILGYSVFRNTSDSVGDDSITIGTSWAVLETDVGNKVNVSFKAPPSGNVEIEFSALVDAVSKAVYFSLSDNATYNELNPIHTYDVSSLRIDETDDVFATVRFVITGLTSGASYQYWIGAKASGSSAYINHGIDRTGAAYSPPITVKAIALPATITAEG